MSSVKLLRKLLTYFNDINDRLTQKKSPVETGLNFVRSRTGLFLFAFFPFVEMFFILVSEFIDATSGINKFHFSGIKGM